MIDYHTSKANSGMGSKYTRHTWGLIQNENKNIPVESMLLINVNMARLCVHAHVKLKTSQCHRLKVSLTLYFSNLFTVNTVSVSDRDLSMAVLPIAIPYHCLSLGGIWLGEIWLGRFDHARELGVVLWAQQINSVRDGWNSFPAIRFLQTAMHLSL
jgi:hypothetical protein